MQPTRGLDMQIGFRRGFFFLGFLWPFWGWGRGVVGLCVCFFPLCTSVLLPHAIV